MAVMMLSTVKTMFVCVKRRNFGIPSAVETSFVCVKRSA